MYSSIYRVQSSTRRLPIRALFGFTLKLVESYLSPPQSPVWWFVLGVNLGSPHTSSHAPSMMSSSSTFLSGTTDNSSVSSTLFDGTRPPQEDPSNNASTVQLKKLYHSISTLESKILNKDSDDNTDEGHILLKGHGCEVSEDELEQQKCKESYSTISGKHATCRSLM